MKLNNDITEEELIELVLTDFRNAKKKQEQNEKIMNSKKFKYGDIVINKNSNRLDKMFGVDDNSIGVIVGCFEIDGITESFGDYRKRYRVYYGQNNSYTGADEDSIELYEGEIPDKLKNVTWNNVYYNGFHA